MAPFAFRKQLSGNPTIPLRVQHNPLGPTLAATGRSGTMTLTEDKDGLHVRALLAKDDPDCQAAVSKVRRGLLDRMSVGMYVDRDSWSQDRSERTVHAARLSEISLVLMPANPGAVAQVRQLAVDKLGYEVRFSPSGIVYRDMSEGIQTDTDDWEPCPQCDSTGKFKGGICDVCGGLGIVDPDADDDEGDGRSARSYTASEIEDLGRQGKAFKNPDGHYSYPIVTRQDLLNAIHAIGRSGLADKTPLRKFIIRRARELNASRLIPTTWASDGTTRSASSPTALRARAASLVGQAIEGEFMAMVQPDWTSVDWSRHYSRMALAASQRGDHELARQMWRAQDAEVRAATLGL
jgi:HK97 family phage prohead protease